MNYFQKRFGFSNLDVAYDKFEKLFLDKYTRDLYSSCYPLKNVTLKDIFRYAILEHPEVEFVDLRYKRAVFVEMLLIPILKKVRYLSLQILRGYEYNNIGIDSFAIVKWFMNGLRGNYLYNSVNLLNVLGDKCSMLPPQIEIAPSSIALLHPSHYRKICPVSVSSQRPGETIMLSPDVRLDKFGQFLD
jgi:hypothetical protein